jgi:hypothetical protein
MIVGRRAGAPSATDHNSDYHQCPHGAACAIIPHTRTMPDKRPKVRTIPVLWRKRRKQHVMAAKGLDTGDKVHQGHRPPTHSCPADAEPSGGELSWLAKGMGEASGDYQMTRRCFEISR